MKTFIITSNAEPTCIVVAEDKKLALKAAASQADEDMGIPTDDSSMGWDATEINDYFSDENEPSFFGWIKSPGQNYMKFS
jgi:hypothetical protein